MLKVDFDTKRTPSELMLYFQEIMTYINTDVESRRSIRLHPGKLITELYPFSLFVSAKYKGDNIKCRIIDGNQGYDGVIYKNGEIIEKVEVCRPIEGRKANEQAKQLNNQGYTEVELYDIVEKQNEIIKLFLQSANKKAKNDYSGCTLLFSISDSDGTFFVDRSGQGGFEGIDRLVTALKKVVFMADKVYLLFEPINQAKLQIISIA